MDILRLIDRSIYTEDPTKSVFSPLLSLLPQGDDNEGEQAEPLILLEDQ